MVLLESNELDYGAGFKDFELVDTRDDQKFSSTSLSKDLVVIAFICNHCPYVVRIVKDFAALAKKVESFTEFVTISANDPDYRQEDSPENMKIFAKDHDFTFPYLFDETQEVAKSFAAVCTPDIFVYKKMNNNYGLVYRAKFEDLEKALFELKDQDKISFEQLPSIGCSIKWLNS